MARIKLTAQELKRQQGDLKRYQRFLPTLVLKKLQIQMEVNRVKQTLSLKRSEEENLGKELSAWVAVLGEDAGIAGLVELERVRTDRVSVAGLEVPVFEGIDFKEVHWDLYAMPLWVDRAVEILRHLLTLRAEILTFRRALDLLEGELRTTIQRVNLFEKVKIPEAIENVRRIRVFLGDQQTAAVARSKLSKAKISREIAGNQLPERVRP